MSGWLSHFILMPIALPLLTAALMLLLDGRGRAIKATINVVSTVLLLMVSIVLLAQAYDTGAEPVYRTGVYLLGNWSAPFGIVLVLDLLSALMLVLGSILALAALVFSLARWHRAGVHFHPLFQLFLMGLNGAFLTGDLFNLFVFFEVMLAASYGLALHGLGMQRIKAGLHYVIINLSVAMIFLVGVALIYGVTGTLNMADLAQRLPTLSGADRALFESGAAILSVAFLLKAGMWPLSFWLPATYTAASPPVAGLFSIMSKLGVYIVLRLWLLLFGSDADAAGSAGANWLLYGGMMTIAFGLIGVLASQETARLAGFSVLVSSGTLLAAIGFHHQAVTAGALFYLVSSTLAIAILFMLTELVERGRLAGADVLAVTKEAFGDAEGEQEEEVGIAVPAVMAILGISFIGCAGLLAGLPPLSGFISKFAILSGLINPAGLGGEGEISTGHWIYVVMLVFSGLISLIAMVRAGIRSFWPAFERSVPHVRIYEMAPVVGLLVICGFLTIWAGPVMRYMDATAAMLHQPGSYMQAVLHTAPVSAEEGVP